MSNSTLTITKDCLSYGVRGSSYRDVLSADKENVTWTVVNGQLPTGLTLNAQTGEITGTPSNIGTHTFVIRAESEGLDPALKEYTIMVSPLEIISSEPTVGIVGYEYNQTFVANAKATWTIIDGTLPNGLILDCETGLVSGVPQARGVFTFELSATNGTETVSRIITFLVIQIDSSRQEAKITNDELSYGVKGSEYLDTLTTDANKATWDITYGELPPGLILNAETGEISGVPSSIGTYTFTAEVKSDNLASGSKEYTLKIYPLTITRKELISGIIGREYSQTLEANTAVTWAILNRKDLPLGLSFDTSTGIISGVPQRSGEYKITVSATNGLVSDTASFIISVTRDKAIYSPLSDTRVGYQIDGLIPQEELRIEKETLSYGIEGGNYKDRLTSNVNNILWWLSSGVLPTGLRLNNETGEISGVPSVPRAYTFTVEAECSYFDSVLKEYTLEIYPRLVSSQDLTLATVGYAYNQKLAGGTNIEWRLLYGELPAGLTFDESAGVITGVPETAGTYKFVAGKVNGTETATIEYVLSVISLDEIATLDEGGVITKDELSYGVRGVPYADRLTANGDNLVWILLSGELPYGLALTPTTGEILGIPTELGTYTFNIAVEGNSILLAQKEYTIRIYPLSVLEKDLDVGIVGHPYRDTLMANTNGITWTMTDGEMPSGLSLNADTGVISGTPLISGACTFTVIATSGEFADTGEFTIKIQEDTRSTPLANARIGYQIDRLIQRDIAQITKNTLQNGLCGNAYLERLTTNAEGAAWTLLSGELPAGLSLNELTGEISGTPTLAGIFTFVVEAESEGIDAGRKEYTLEIVPLTILTDTLTIGTVGYIYRQELISNWSAIWTVSDGEIPAGLILDAETGVISGIPQAKGTYIFTITATVGLNAITKEYTLPVIELDQASLSSEIWTAINLPPGLKLSSAGLLYGKPIVTGTYESTITVKTNWCKVSRKVIIRVIEEEIENG